ncbi:hypothetical protein NY406_03415 [Chlorobaculum sp. MV4-Y]|uniref:hypothetical protein n=1 Tax=Chlorobaculum sp. MV4-Y TaxID=2976335 RepID=UPI0021B06CC5|nr:hypothetical protein [Chlorobaculum sp. MV4-Y]UWX58333.1 hypothetical protein NY406_03415 [Chlorobaculum sp. MV4-Y]
MSRKTVCFLDGEFKTKRIVLVVDSLCIIAAEAHEQAIKISGDSDFQVWGLVICVIHKTREQGVSSEPLGSIAVACMFCVKGYFGSPLNGKSVVVLFNNTSFLIIRSNKVKVLGFLIGCPEKLPTIPGVFFVSGVTNWKGEGVEPDRSV